MFDDSADMFEHCDSEETQIITDAHLQCTLPIPFEFTQPTAKKDCPPSVPLDQECTKILVEKEDSSSTLFPDLASTLPCGEDEFDEFSDPFNFTQEQLAELDLAEINTSGDENTYTFHGCKIIFPYKAYESQEQMMDKLIKGAQSSQNCLLESPTGTGKTAALICALRAWQLQFEEAEEERYVRWQEDLWEKSQIESKTLEEDNNSTLPSPSKKSKVDETPPKRVENEPENSFQAKQVPIIYYATRTHSQIKQVIKQMSQTKYKDTPMTILASRKQTCINPKALASDSVENTCQTFRHEFERQQRYPPPKTKEPTCPFYAGPLQKSSFKEGYQSTWDIEDIKAHGEECGSCPYQEMRPLQREARIVFCTYNHMLNKHIRKALKIDLVESIVVFDEAHNIEDNCRSIASLKGDQVLSLNKVNYILLKFDESMKKKRDQQPPKHVIDSLLNLIMAFRRLFNWLEDQLKCTASGFTYIPEESNIIMKRFKRNVSETLIDEMSQIQFGPEQIRQLWSNYFTLDEQLFSKDETTQPPVIIDSDALRAVNSILFVLSLIYKKDPVTKELLYFNDYEKFLIKTVKQAPQNHSAITFTSSSQQSKPDDNSIEMNLLCLNPAIVFEKMRSARTIIVTSGTLSPTNSFATELNTNFQLELSANHVMGPDRIFTAIINSCSKTDKKLNFNANSLKDESIYADHQDQLFNSIFRISNQVPFGILVFVPSSTFITRLKSEWGRNHNLERLREVKDVFFEHENRHPNEFNRMMACYRAKVEVRKGAIMFAVLRGKISEGVDFKDNQARAVITIGIPFAPCKNDGILAKQKYNNEKKIKNTSYLSGKDWYNADAFRALNQAFGRCVRHVNDWGAILIVDSRFTDYPNYRNYLSKWVQDSLTVPRRVTNGSLEEVMPHLKSFVENLC